MNKVFLLLIAAVMQFTTASAHDSWPTMTKAKKHFDRQFKNAKDVTWETSPVGYAVTFKTNDAVSTAYYDDQGYWVGVGNMIANEALPAHISKYAKKYYSDSNIHYSFKLTTSLKEVEYYVLISKGEQSSWLKYSCENGYQIINPSFR